MGKIKIKTIGDETLEEQEKKEAKIKRGQKKAREEAVEPVEEAKQPEKTEDVKEEKAEKKSKTSKQKSAKKARPRSKKYNEAKLLVDKTKQYSLAEALDLLPKLKLSKFDETVELHVNTTEQGVSGTLNLPHGTGKKVRVVVADDKVIAEIEKGKINFDILVAEPQMMAKLAKVAKVLGPRGLMPNPKNGTVTPKPEEVVKKFEAGQMHYKTESKAPIIHLTVGKLSFGSGKLKDNIDMVLKTIGTTKVRSVTLKSTMSPGIKIAVV